MVETIQAQLLSTHDQPGVQQLSGEYKSPFPFPLSDPSPSFPLMPVYTPPPSCMPPPPLAHSTASQYSPHDPTLKQSPVDVRRDGGVFQFSVNPFSHTAAPISQVEFPLQFSQRGHLSFMISSFGRLRPRWLTDPGW